MLFDLHNTPIIAGKPILHKKILQNLQIVQGGKLNTTLFYRVL